MDRPAGTAQSDRTIGVAIHQPVTVIKVMDKSSPKLFGGLCKAENLDKVYSTMATTISFTKLAFRFTPSDQFGKSLGTSRPVGISSPTSRPEPADIPTRR